MGVAEIHFRQSGRGTSHDDAVAATVLGLVESIVGELEQQIDAIGGFVKGSYPDRGG